MNRVTVGAGIALAVAGTGVFLTVGGDSATFSASRAYQKLEALSTKELFGSEGKPSPDRSLLRAGAGLAASGASLEPRPVFEDDDLAASPLPAMEDERASGQLDDAADARAMIAGGALPGREARAASRPAVAHAADARHAPASVTRRPGADSGPVVRPPAGHATPGLDRRPAQAAPSAPPAATPPFVMPAPVETRGLAASNPAHDDPDSVLPPSPP